MFTANSKYQTPERRQVNDGDLQENVRTYFLSRSSVFIANIEHAIAGYKSQLLINLNYKIIMEQWPSG